MIARLLFERPVLLFLMWLAVELAIVAVWSRRRTRGSRRVAVAGLLVMPLLMTVSFGVVTPGERIITICRELAHVVEQADVVGLDRRLDVDFEAVDLNRGAFVDRVERSLSRFHVKDAHLYRFSVTFPQPEMGVVEFNTSCFIDALDVTHQRLLSRWRLTFRQSDRVWLVTRVEAVPTPLSPIHDLRHLTSRAAARQEWRPQAKRARLTRSIPQAGCTFLAVGAPPQMDV